MQTFDKWFDSYSQMYSKDQWSLRDAWDAALRAKENANRPSLAETLSQLVHSCIPCKGTGKIWKMTVRGGESAYDECLVCKGYRETMARLHYKI